MQEHKILEEILKLPKAKQLYVEEKTMKSTRTEEEKQEMEKVAEILLPEYETNVELAIFTQIDFDDFYETNRLNKISSADCFQIRSVSTKRFEKKIGEVSMEIQEKLK